MLFRSNCQKWYVVESTLKEISHSPLRLALARFLCTIETGSVSKPDRRGSTREGTVRLGAVCPEELKRRARRRAQFSPRTQHAFTQHEWRIHHPQQTTVGITRARNKLRFCFSALGLAVHESCQQDPQHGAGSQNESSGRACYVVPVRSSSQHVQASEHLFNVCGPRLCYFVSSNASAQESRSMAVPVPRWRIRGSDVQRWFGNW